MTPLNWETCSSHSAYPLQAAPGFRHSAEVLVYDCMDREAASFKGAKCATVTVVESASMQFGLYLKNKGVITAEQLVAALEVQLATLPRIGQLAMEEGLLTAPEVFDVLHAQRETPQLRFGELALELGLMTPAQLEHLLILQTARKRPIAEILVAKGLLSKEQADREMAEFRSSLAKRRAPTLAPSKIQPVSRRMVRTHVPSEATAV